MQALVFLLEEATPIPKKAKPYHKQLEEAKKKVLSKQTADYQKTSVKTEESSTFTH